MSNPYYRNTFRNRYRRYDNNNNTNLNIHFDNINLLANIIQDSQRLLEQQQQRSQPDELSNIVFRFDTLFQSNRENNENNEISYNIVNINDETDVYLFQDMSSQNIELYDVSCYKYIPNPLNDTCSITRELFMPEQNVIMISHCRHIFCKPNLNRWLRQHNTCPCCRARIRQTSSIITNRLS